MQIRLPTLTLSTLVLIAAAVCFTACATQEEQLAAAKVDDTVTIVCSDLEAYLDAAIAPDGSPMSAAEVYQKRGGVITLRNALHVAMGREKEPLPEPDFGPARIEIDSGAGDLEEDEPGLSNAGR